jgi:hypothetical protein
MRQGILVGVSMVIASVMLLAPLAGAAPVSTGGAAGASAFFGVLTISPSCALSDANAPISQSGTTFTLTGTLNGSLVILCPDATVDGAGHRLNYSIQPHGNPDAALTVNDSAGVTVENLVFENVTDGIVANDSARLTLTGNTIGAAGIDAIIVENSPRLTISDNRINNSNDYAIYLENVTGASISGNDGNGSYYGIEASESTGLSIVRNNDSFGEYGVGLNRVNDSSVTDGQEFEDTYPLWVDFGLNDTFNGNNANASTYCGIYSDGGTRLTATNNYVIGAREYASYVEYSSGVTERNNNGDRSPEGFYSQYSSDLTFTGDNASFAETGFQAYYTTFATYSGDLAFADFDYAFYLDYASDTLVSGNHAPFAGRGVYCAYDNGTSVVGNDFSNSTLEGVDSEYTSSNLVVQHNDLANATEEGAYLYEPYGPVSITNNDILGSRDEGVYVEVAYGTVTVSGNDIVNAADDGVEVDDAYGGVSVSDNDIANVGLSYGVYIDEAYGSTSVVGNNVSNAGGTGIELEETYGSANVTDNVAVNASGDGIIAYETYGSLAIVGNDVARSPSDGIYTEETFGMASIEDNDVANSAIGILEDEPFGPSQILGNDVLHSTEEGIGVEYAYEYGGVLVQGNNASSSLGAALEYYDSDLPSSVIGNDLSNSKEAVITDSSALSFVANDLRNVGSILVTDDELAAFYHNDLNTTAFNGSGTTMQVGPPNLWNAPYPIGGNYWSGYAGKDLFSGPAQNISGSDGIGDTPEPVPSVGAGAVDEYPLTHPWTDASSVLQFTATGLPSTTAWSVTVSFEGYGSGSTTGSGVGSAPITIMAAYGAVTPFTYVVTPVAGYVASPHDGSASTGYGATQFSVAFKPFTYTATFTATGISSGTSWSVSVGGSAYPSTTLRSNVSLANGTYTWTATTVGSASVTGTVVVNGANVSVSVAFPGSKVTLPRGLFAVVFVEDGVSGGASWSVTFNGSTQSSTGNTIIFSAANGSYSYTVTTTGSAAPQRSAGSVTVVGSATEVTLLFGSATGAVSGSSTGPSWNELYALLGLAVLFAVLAVIGWIRSGRKGGPSTTPAGPPPSWAGPASPSPGPYPPTTGSAPAAAPSWSETPTAPPPPPSA